MEKKCKSLIIKIREMKSSQGISNVQSTECLLKKDPNPSKMIEIKRSYKQTTGVDSGPSLECYFFSNENTKCEQCVYFEAQ
jgi:hypothetical protein